MQLPPEQKNEPEWLQIQRRRRRETNNWTYSGFAAMLLGAILYGIVEASLQPELFGQGSLVPFYIAATLTFIAVIGTWRSDKGTFQRGFAGWSVATHGLIALTFLATALRQL